MVDFWHEFLWFCGESILLRDLVCCWQIRIASSVHVQYPGYHLCPTCWQVVWIIQMQETSSALFCQQWPLDRRPSQHVFLVPTPPRWCWVPPYTWCVVLGTTSSQNPNHTCWDTHCTTITHVRSWLLPLPPLTIRPTFYVVLSRVFSPTHVIFFFLDDSQRHTETRLFLFSFHLSFVHVPFFYCLNVTNTIDTRQYKRRSK